MVKILKQAKNITLIKDIYSIFSCFMTILSELCFITTGKDFEWLTTGDKIENCNEYVEGGKIKTEISAPPP